MRDKPMHTARVAKYPPRAEGNMGNETSSEYCGYRVLSVQKNSPGYEAGLILF